MENTFEADEKLYRAVYPPEHSQIFWKKDGTISSAAFADKRGLSVDRGNYRDDEEVVEDIKKRLKGRIISVLVQDCLDVSADVLYLPSRNNIYHSEIHGSDRSVLLSKSQRYHLASMAKIVS